MIEPNRRTRWSTRYVKNLLAVLLLAAVVLVGYVQAHFTVGFDLQGSRCLPWTVYLVSKSDDIAVERGGIYQYHYDADERLANRPLLKLAAGTPGDQVRTDPTGVWINGRYWGPMHPLQVKRLEHSGKSPIASFVIPKGKLLMLGTLPQTYDGRYVGLVDESAIEGRARPLW